MMINYIIYITTNLSFEEKITTNLVDYKSQSIAKFKNCQPLIV